MYGVGLWGADDAGALSALSGDVRSQDMGLTNNRAPVRTLIARHCHDRSRRASVPAGDRDSPKQWSVRCAPPSAHFRNEDLSCCSGRIRTTRYRPGADGNGRRHSAHEGDVVGGRRLPSRAAHEQRDLAAMIAAMKDYLKQHVLNGRLEREPCAVGVRDFPLQLLRRERLEERAERARVLDAQRRGLARS